jgi:pyrroloquinoline quinone biosynthesis protein D
MQGPSEKRKVRRLALAPKPWDNSLVTPNPQSHPRLAPGCRLAENEQEHMLMMPERALRLNGPSLEIVQRCDGKHTVREIVNELQQIYSKAKPEKVEQDILGYLKLLNDERALDFEP